MDEDFAGYDDANVLVEERRSSETKRMRMSRTMIWSFIQA